MVRIHDHFSPVDFMVLDMGEEEDDTPINSPRMNGRKMKNRGGITPDTHGNGHGP